MIENIKAFVADIDGTMADKGGDLHPKTREMITRLHNDGVLLGLSSGRPLDERIIYKGTRDWSLDFDFDFAIGSNGADVWDRFHDGISYNYMLEPETVREILDIIWDLDMNIIVYNDAYNDVLIKRMDWFMELSIMRNASKTRVVTKEEMCTRPYDKIECHYLDEYTEEFDKVINAHKSDKWIPVHTHAGTVEFVDPHVNKGMGVQMLMDRNNIDIKDVIAFGDWNNDLEMVRDAGWGVCLKNGSDDVKAVADAVTDVDCNEGGVGDYLEKYWYNKK